MKNCWLVLLGKCNSCSSRKVGTIVGTLPSSPVRRQKPLVSPQWEGWVWVGLFLYKTLATEWTHNKLWAGLGLRKAKTITVLCSAKRKEECMNVDHLQEGHWSSLKLKTQIKAQMSFEAAANVLLCVICSNAEIMLWRMCEMLKRTNNNSNKKGKGLSTWRSPSSYVS